MEELCKITFENSTHKAVISIMGENYNMESASIEFFPALEVGQTVTLPGYLAGEYIKHLIKD